MGNFIFTVGCPGAGKSTYAELKASDGWLKLCLDDFRIALCGSKQTFWRTVERGGVEAENALAAVLMIYTAAFERLLYLECNVVVANIHISQRVEADFLSARARGHAARIVVFSTDLDTLLDRNQTRPEDDRVGEDFLREQYQAFVTKPGWWENYPSLVEVRRS